MAPRMGFPGVSGGKESACNARDLGSIPWWGSSPGEGNGYPLQYSCQENSMDREWDREESDMTERLTLSECGWTEMRNALHLRVMSSPPLPVLGQSRGLGSWEGCIFCTLFEKASCVHD